MSLFLLRRCLRRSSQYGDSQRFSVGSAKYCSSSSEWRHSWDRDSFLPTYRGRAISTQKASFFQARLKSVLHRKSFMLLDGAVRFLRAMYAVAARETSPFLHSQSRKYPTRRSPLRKALFMPPWHILQRKSGAGTDIRGDSASYSILLGVRHWRDSAKSRQR